MPRKLYLLNISLITLLMLCSSVQAATSVKIVNLDAYDLVYDQFSQRIYASVSSTDLNYGNSIAIINPVTGAVEDSVFVGSDPRKLAIANDGEYIYAGLYSAGSVSRFHIPSQTVDKTFSLGTGSYAEDIDVQPGNSNVIAVSRYCKGVSPRHDGVAIYDNGIKLPQQTAAHTGSNVIEFSDSPNILYGYCNETTGFGVYTNIVNDYGVSIGSSYSGLISGFGVDIEYDDGCLYTTTGRIINTQIMQLAGQFGVSGMIEPDSTVRRTFFVSGSTISAYNQKTFLEEGRYTISGTSGSPRNLIRWGINGLAYSTSGKQVVIVQTDLVPEPPALTSLVIEGPSHLPGYKGEYKLVATFDDDVVLDVTQKSRWSTEPDTFTSINNTGTLYVFGTEEAGTTTINAQYMWAGTQHQAAKEITYDGVLQAVGNLIRLEIDGPRQVLQESQVNFTATAFFDDNTQYNVTNKVIWRLSNTEFADINESGLLTVGQIAQPRDLVLYASFGYKDVELETIKTVIVLEDASQMSTSDWPTYQGNTQHTGYVPIALDPEDFSLRWERTLSNSLKPVSAATGRVFIGTTSELSCLDARDGETLWSVSDYCQHQPTYAYGNVYLQVGRHSSSTPKSYLKAYTADQGEPVFTSPFSQQWYTWLAPAVYDGGVYIGGGYYGGMYGFDAFSGDQMWSRSLPQEDGWTPAVDGDYSYAFVEGTLYAINRHYGTQDFTIEAGSSSSTQVPVKGSYNDILVTNGSTLYCLNLLNKEIKWEISGSYSAMPSVAEGVVYAVNNGALEARDEGTGSFIWSWTPPEGNLKSPFIVTETHVIACTNTNTYTIEILSRDSDWSYPATGSLSLGNDTLYIAGGNGVLTAIATPEYIPATPVKLEIEGPGEIFESSTNPYQAKVTYSDGRVRYRTAMCNWTLTETLFCVFNDGSLSVGELLYPQATVLLQAAYAQDGTTVTDTIEITINVSCSVEELVTRNLEKTMQSKEKILYELQQALMYEKACSAIIRDLRNDKNTGISQPDLNKARNQVALARVFENTAEKFVETSVENLLVAVDIFAPESPFIERLNNYLDSSSEDTGNAPGSDGQPTCGCADLTGDDFVDLNDFACFSGQWLQTCQ
jgi:outer membrane protein assembly factor BamB